jgi:hypothetical protein
MADILQECQVDSSSIEVKHRFRGPPHSGNGGYVCGLLARQAGFQPGAEVTLRAPTPLGRPLSLIKASNAEATMTDGMTIIATARPFVLDIEALPQVSLAEALAATARSIGPAQHILPHCFVCGPGRNHGDGLRVFAGPLDASDTNWTGPLAAAWTPDQGLAAEDGLVASEFVWSALDCPTGYTALKPDGHGTGPNGSMLLGRLSARIDRRPAPGEPCVVVTKLISRDGRKITADGILRDALGETLAVARALWITVDRAVMFADRTT